MFSANCERREEVSYREQPEEFPHSNKSKQSIEQAHSYLTGRINRNVAERIFDACQGTHIQSTLPTLDRSTRSLVEHEHILEHEHVVAHVVEHEHPIPSNVHYIPVTVVAYHVHHKDMFVYICIRMFIDLHILRAPEEIPYCEQLDRLLIPNTWKMLLIPNTWAMSLETSAKRTPQDILTLRNQTQST